MTVRTYLLVDAGADDASYLAESLRSVSLANCLQLVHTWGDPQVVVRVECTALPDLYHAVAHDLAETPGVAGITTLAIYPER
jgi:hypothetical protein